ncbi:MAG: iron ABC transporter permease [Bacteroidales bacterium]|jgi:iron complex transport system permease protein|nr:iron ABC transporter permease [Bacteroidales bacterium]MDD3273491.1 iron ABC transporter permease [Bacteroidales bacterium]MDD4058390.1 iron ABC transporter permease [Bacteroidales bacterium]
MELQAVKALSIEAGKILFLVTLLIMASALSLCTGEISITPDRVLFYLKESGAMEYQVLHNIRIPRTILAIAIGGSLGLSGVILQGIYRNPLVEPYTLGISGGASLGITFVIVTGLQSAGELTLPLAGFTGALITVFLVYFLSYRREGVSTNRMLLTGVMISFISSSAVMFLMSVTAIENIHGIVFWTMGSLNESNPLMVYGILILSLTGLTLSYLFTAPLNALRLGESSARSLGINTKAVICILFFITSLLTGSSIAVAGVIGFVGLVIPHFARLISGTDYRSLLIISFLSGGVFMLLCDILARTLVFPNELPIGVITGIFGGVTFISLIWIKKRT